MGEAADWGGARPHPWGLEGGAGRGGGGALPASVSGEGLEGGGCLAPPLPASVSGLEGELRIGEWGGVGSKEGRGIARRHAAARLTHARWAGVAAGWVGQRAAAAAAAAAAGAGTSTK